MKKETRFLIVFVELGRYAVQSLRVDDTELASVMDHYYEKVAAAVEGARGRVVKFMGDGALAVFPPAAAGRAIAALVQLRQDIDEWFGNLGWECRLRASAHLGTVVAGDFGGARNKRFDVIGKAVNEAAMLEGTGITLSAEAFAALTPERRRHFKKLDFPACYIGDDDLPPLRRRRS
jgi:adenylate cyclase